MRKIYSISVLFRYPALEKPAHFRGVEKTIGDFLAFLMLFISTKKAQSYLLTEMWIKSLLRVLEVNEEGIPKVNSLRPKLLAIKLLATLLPEDPYYGISKSSSIHIYDSAYKQQVLILLFFLNEIEREDIAVKLMVCYSFRSSPTSFVTCMRTCGWCPRELNKNTPY